MEWVLPGVRARRRRRKPMPPWLKVAIFIVALDLWLVGQNTGQMMAGTAEWTDVLAGLGGAVSLAIWWPILQREWKAWRDDDG